MAMTLEQVRDRLRSVDHNGMPGDTCDDLADAIDAHLAQPAQSVAAKDAEIARLVGRAVPVVEWQAMESRLAAANALLRKVYAYLDRCDPNSDVYDEVEAHLQGAGDEA